MSKVWSVAAQEIRNTFKRRSYLLLTFGVPLVALIAVVAMTLWQAGKADEPEDPFADLPDEPIGYVDHSGLFSEPGQFAMFLVSFEDEVAAREGVRTGELFSYYVIPKDYLETGEVTRFSAQFNIAESDMGLFQSFLVASLLGGDNPRLLARLESPAYVIEHQLDLSGKLVTEIEGDSFSNFGLVYAYALIMMFATFMSSSQLVASVVTEKENRTIEMVLSSLRPIQLLAGKVLGQGLSGLVQIVAWLGAVLLMIQITGADVPLVGQLELPPSMLVTVLLYFVGGFLLFGAFASGIGAISVNMREGPQYSVIYTLPAVVPLMLMANILEAPNGTLAVVLSFIPICSPLGMIERMVITAVPGWQIAASVAILFAAVVGALWLAAKLFRVNTLLSGQLPTRSELIRLLVRE